MRLNWSKIASVAKAIHLLASGVSRARLSYLAGISQEQLIELFNRGEITAEEFSMSRKKSLTYRK